MYGAISSNSLLKRLGSLPPCVEGKIHGYLSMTVDIQWKEKALGAVYVYAAWWGEKQKVLFIPQGSEKITQTSGSPEASYIYRIMTNLELLVSYLQDCEELNFEVFEKDTMLYLGTATLKYLVSVVLDNPFRTICAVTNRNGQEIADLKISFMLHFNEVSDIGICDVESRSQTVHSVNAKKVFVRKEGVCVAENTNSIDLSQYNHQNNSVMQEKIKNSTTCDANEYASIKDLFNQNRVSCQCLDSQSVKLKSNEETGKSSVYIDAVVRKYLSGKHLTENEERIALESVKFKSSLQEILRVTDGCHKSSEQNDFFSEKIEEKLLITNKNKRCQCNVLNHVLPLEGTSRYAETSGKQLHDTQNKDIINELTLNYADGILIDLFQNENAKYPLKMLCLTVQTVSLNHLGMQRVLASSSANPNAIVNTQQFLPRSVFFVEYEIPQCLREYTNEIQKTTKPWISNLTRVCSRYRKGKVIHFDRQTFHLLASHKPRFKELLYSSLITFKVYSRQMNQRLPCFLGQSTLHFVKALNSLQKLPILLQSSSNVCHTLSLGVLKLKIEFRANQNCLKPKGSLVMMELLPSSSDDECECKSENLTQYSKIITKFHTSKVDNAKSSKDLVISNRKINTTGNFTKTKFKNKHALSKNANAKKENILLFGLLHISEGRKMKYFETYLITHGFWLEDVMKSDIHWNTENPTFKFHKIMPVLLSLELLDRCYNNFMIVEVWSQDVLVGIVKLPLNQFYIAYRDPQVVEQLLSSKYPIISTDGWVDVHDPLSQHKVGLLNVVLALGTEDQIQMLEMSRCLKQDSSSQQLTFKNISEDISPAISRSLLLLNETSDIQEVTKLEAKNDQTKEDLCDCYPNECTHLCIINSSVSKESSFIPYDSSGICNQVYDDESSKAIVADEQLEISQFSLNSNPISVALSPPNSREISETNEIRSKSLKTLPNTSKDKASQHDLPLSNANRVNGVGKPLPEKDDVLQSCADNRDKHDSNVNSIKKKKINLYRQSTRISDCNIGVSNDNQRNLTIQENISVPKNDEMIEENKEKNFLHAESCDLRQGNSWDYQNDMYLSNCKYGGFDGEMLKNDTSDEKEDKDDNSVHSNEFSEHAPHSLHNLPSEFVDSLSQFIFDSKYDEIYGKKKSASAKSIDDITMRVSTENASIQTDILASENFVAIVEIISAVNIPKLASGKLPTCYVTFQSAENSILSTDIIHQSTSPIWNWSCKVWLPVLLLENNTRCLIFKLWHKHISNEDQNYLEDFVIGFSAIDLTVLICGMPSLSGWFNVTDLSGNCKGQMQVSITPVEDLTQMNFRPEIYKMTNGYMKSCPAHSFSERSEHIYSDQIVEEEAETGCFDQEGRKANKSVQNQLNDISLGIPKDEICCGIDAGEHHSAKDSHHYPMIDLMTKPQQISMLIHSNFDDSITNLSGNLHKKLDELNDLIQSMKNRREQLKHTKHKRKIPQESEENVPFVISGANESRQPLDITEHVSPTFPTGTFNTSANNNVSSKYKPVHSSKYSCDNEISVDKCAQNNVSCSQQCLSSTSSFSTGVKDSVLHSGSSKFERLRVPDDAHEDNISENMPSNLTTDHLMCEAFHEMDLENVFNPLLFQHIISSRQFKNYSHLFEKTCKRQVPIHKILHNSILLSNINKPWFCKSHNSMKIRNLAGKVRENYCKVEDEVDDVTIHLPDKRLIADELSLHDIDSNCDEKCKFHRTCACKYLAFSETSQVQVNCLNKKTLKPDVSPSHSTSECINSRSIKEVEKCRPGTIIDTLASSSKELLRNSSSKSPYINSSENISPKYFEMSARKTSNTNTPAIKKV